MKFFVRLLDNGRILCKNNTEGTSKVMQPDEFLEYIKEKIEENYDAGQVQEMELKKKAKVKADQIAAMQKLGRDALLKGKEKK